jgi:hypothetical protein
VKDTYSQRTLIAKKNTPNPSRTPAIPLPDAIVARFPVTLDPDPEKNAGSGFQFPDFGIRKMEGGFSMPRARAGSV